MKSPNDVVAGEEDDKIPLRIGRGDMTDTRDPARASPLSCWAGVDVRRLRVFARGLSTRPDDGTLTDGLGLKVALATIPADPLRESTSRRHAGLPGQHLETLRQYERLGGVLHEYTHAA